MCSRLLKKVTANYDLCCVVVGLDLVGPFYLSAGQGCRIVLGAWQQKICAWQNA